MNKMNKNILEELRIIDISLWFRPNNIPKSVTIYRIYQYGEELDEFDNVEDLISCVQEMISKQIRRQSY